MSEKKRESLSVLSFLFKYLTKAFYYSINLSIFVQYWKIPYSIMRHKLFLFLILLLAYTTHVYGGIKLYSEHMKTSDGLPSNTIRYLHQDCKGFLWIGTLNGLSRYDGNSFITFQPQDEIKPALSVSFITNSMSRQT